MRHEQRLAEAQKAYIMRMNIVLYEDYGTLCSIALAFGLKDSELSWSLWLSLCHLYIQNCTNRCGLLAIVFSKSCCLLIAIHLRTNPRSHQIQLQASRVYFQLQV